jgi:hypothetical protein
MRNLRIAALGLLFAGLTVTIPSRSPAAGPEADPDWPCLQRRVPEISVGQVWAGPSLEGLPSWRDDPAVAAVVRHAASRRVPVEEAVEAVASFAASQGPDRGTKIRQVMAGVLDTINAERASIIAGIGRYARRQRQLADRIAATGEQIDALPPDNPDAGNTERADLLEVQAWDTRIFEDRQRSLSYVCDQPVLLEQRAFRIGREAGALISGD